MEFQCYDWLSVMAWIRQHKSRVHRLISAVLPCLSVAAVQPRFGNVTVLPRLSVVAVQQCSHVSVTSRHLKIGWFKVIKGNGMGDNPSTDQHQLMDQ
jgi:hypothetical protein